MNIKYLLTCVVIVILSPWLMAQDTGDSTALITVGADTVTVDSDEIIEIETDTLENRPGTAALYSAALPGLGQAYNKKYWKIPILYGGGLVIGYFIGYNHRLYKQYRDGLIALIDQDDRTEPFDPRLGQNDYQRAVDYWRRNRDLLMIGAVVLYVAAIVDAHVDAHLELFTVEDDISLNLEPSFDTTAMQTNLFGVSLKLRF
ncbi:MAG: DUF5683 domain-containing protein [Cytophagales bacterium]|nr:DUF5683 domain-containing protein [Cytophagales bacterium]